jgi:predicted Zn-dependent protease
MLAVRVAGIVLALVACAWFGLSVHQARDTARAGDLLSGRTSLSAAQARQARSLLDGAATLNPDSEVDLLRSELELVGHDRRSAVRTLEQVVRREPMNAEAWLLLARAAFPDAALLHRAVRHIARLDPLG